MHLAGRLFTTHGQTFSRACRDLSFDTPVGRWNALEAQPAPDLADAVDCYWEGWGDVPPLKEKIMPRPGVELMFNLKGRHSVLELDGRPLGSNHSGGWLSGMQRRYMLIETREGSHFICATLKPWGAWRLLREPMTDVSCRVPLIDEIWGAAIHALAERLFEAPNPFARFDILEDFLRRRIDLRTRSDANVIEAVRRLRARSGMLRIEALCRELGLSRATLARRFHEQVGLSPKTYARVLRIGALMQQLDATVRESAGGGATDRSHGSETAWLRGGGPDWARIAADFGYHDQAHLVHDFRDFCGATPGEYLARATSGAGFTVEDPPG